MIVSCILNLISHRNILRSSRQGLRLYRGLTACVRLHCIYSLLRQRATVAANCVVCCLDNLDSQCQRISLDHIRRCSDWREPHGGFVSRRFRFLDHVGIRVAEVGYRDLLRFEVVVAIHEDTIVSRSSFASPVALLFLFLFNKNTNPSANHFQDNGIKGPLPCDSPSPKAKLDFLF